MNINIRIAGILCVASLIGCTNPFESRTCGIKNSQWDQMTVKDQIDFQKSFNEKQRLADQMELNKMSTKQEKNLANARRNNEKAQARRLNEEREDIKKQQGKIKTDLKTKEQAYLHPNLSPENGCSAEARSE